MSRQPPPEAAPSLRTIRRDNSLVLFVRIEDNVTVPTTRLYRPVGQRELDLIEASGWTRFPPRLDWQPIFYPVLTEDYATRIARDWNTKDDENGNVGYVTAFDVDKAFLSRYEVHDVGGRELQEYWIPAEELDEFNRQIVGRIEVLSEWRGTPPVRVR